MPELESQASKTRKRSRLLVLASLLVLALSCVPPGWNYYRVAAVQNALQRNWEIRFEKDGKPDAMPKFLDDKVQELLGHTENRWGEQIPCVVFRERVRAMFRGRIDEIHIYYPEDIRGDLGAALLKFGELRKLVVFENEEHLPAEASYKLLCQRLRSSKNLEELELGGGQITSDALAPLAGHPKLRRLNISGSYRLTVDVLETFKTLPALATLEIEDIYGPAEEEWKSPALHAQFREALPGVTLTLPQP
ncbi:hypothetical protein DES53_102598 [Roseimicrobium gellanilyticum]|uniref:Leucine rich repeat (LRR) protein n=1 Tax=Roseimicrobium gellanilyticum TaxID=748857 RepID=A0A366HRC3_9BACT|nr:leucine-rich repeat domain-containing protein [Roseimicrobium gellanilyticum]RBP46212.1 hypothetical protein DES53_102598 [Roseimicrobium gellanilyticum]